MYNNILVPIAADHDPNTDRAIGIARALAADGAKITALTVMELMPGYIVNQLPEGHKAKARAELEAGLKEGVGVRLLPQHPGVAGPAHTPLQVSGGARAQAHLLGQKQAKTTFLGPR